MAYIDLPEDLEIKLAECARMTGHTRQFLIRRAVEHYLTMHNDDLLSDSIPEDEQRSGELLPLHAVRNLYDRWQKTGRLD